MKTRFFSIIIPAHNEERCLGGTLEKVSSLDYPKESYEAIVVENGSTDRTLEIAHSYARDNIRVFTSEKGVSRAKNTGLDEMSPQSDWIVFLDADTLLGPAFLSSLNAYFEKHSSAKFTAGTTTVLPDGGGWYARAWFAFYNFGHWLTDTSYAIQLAKASLKNEFRFDETITFTEDLKLIKKAKQHGKFFYFRTKEVVTSIRRFKEVGWFTLFLKWNREALLLSDEQRRKEQYKVIR